MAKYPSWTGKTEALLNLLGGEEIGDRLLQEGFTLEFTSELSARLSLKPKPLFDRTGRCIQARDLKSNVCDPNRGYFLTQPELDYAARLARMQQYLTFLSPIGMTAEEFERQSVALIEQLRGDVRFANALNGVCLPIVIPAMAVTNYGETLESLVNVGLTASYRAEFPKRAFTNHRNGDLVDKVSVVSGSRHDQLIDRIAEGAVVALYFPNPLQGYSINAGREQIAHLPEGWLLAGGIDTTVAYAAYPDVLGRDGKTPVLTCNALDWKSAECSLYFNAVDGSADFADTDDLSGANDPPQQWWVGLPRECNLGSRSLFPCFFWAFVPCPSREHAPSDALASKTGSCYPALPASLFSSKSCAILNIESRLLYIGSRISVAEIFSLVFASEFSRSDFFRMREAYVTR